MRVLSTVIPFALLCAVCATTDVAQATEPTVEEVFNRVQSSVVTLYTEQRTGLTDREGVAQTIGGNGSGVLIDGGRILTAAHVVHSVDKVEVRFADGTRVPARIVGSVVQADVAMVQLDVAPPQGVRPAVLADSDKVRIGSRCLAVGAPHGLTHSLTVGYVSARRSQDHPTLDILDVEHFQTDAQINPGNSGGPLFDMNGQVIGIVVHNITSTGGSVGLGFAVTSNTTRRYLLDRNPIWSGMTEIYLTGQLAQAFQLPEGQSGFLLQHVAKNSPADPRHEAVDEGQNRARNSADKCRLKADVERRQRSGQLDAPAEKSRHQAKKEGKCRRGDRDREAEADHAQGPVGPVPRHVGLHKLPPAKCRAGPESRSV